MVVVADPAVALAPAGCGPDEPVSAAALRGETIIGRLDEAARGLEEQYGLAPAVRHRGETEEHVRMLVRAGLGIAPSTARRQPSGDLVQRPITPPHAVEVFVAAIAGRTLPLAAELFLRLARARDWDAHP